MNKRTVLAAAAAVAVISAGITGGVILGQSGGGRPERYVDPLLTPTPVSTNPDCIADPDALGCPPPPLTPQPSPVVIRTDIPPIPFETGLRTDCPQGWDSIGQPGVFSMCYPSSDWMADVRIDEESGTELSWRSFVGLTSQKDSSQGLAVRFFPRGIPADPNPCEDPYASRVSPTARLDVAGHEGLTCVLAEEGPPLRLYIVTQQISSGTLVAQTYVEEPPDEAPGGLPDRVLQLFETLQVQP